jgi:hypothetical protein
MRKNRSSEIDVLFIVDLSGGSASRFRGATSADCVSALRDLPGAGFEPWPSCTLCYCLDQLRAQAAPACAAAGRGGEVSSTRALRSHQHLFGERPAPGSSRQAPLPPVIALAVIPADLPFSGNVTDTPGKVDLMDRGIVTETSTRPDAGARPTGALPRGHPEGAALTVRGRLAGAAVATGPRRDRGEAAPAQRGRLCPRLERVVRRELASATRQRNTWSRLL